MGVKLVLLSLIIWIKAHLGVILVKKLSIALLLIAHWLEALLKEIV